MHGGIDQIVVTADSVWTPDIMLINSESDGFDPKFRANVLFTFDGQALWIPPTLQISSCEGNSSNFIFDFTVKILAFRLILNFKKSIQLIFHLIRKNVS